MLSLGPIGQKILVLVNCGVITPNLDVGRKRPASTSSVAIMLKFLLSAKGRDAKVAAPALSLILEGMSGF